MEIPKKTETLSPSDVKASPTKHADALFVNLLPHLHSSVNKLLEECTPNFPKKVGIALWAIEGSRKRDEVGQYLTTRDLVSTFRAWFIRSKSNARSEVSKAKKEMFALGLIKVEGGSDHIHLTSRGQVAVTEMTGTARRVLSKAISVLSLAEQLSLFNYAKRMIDARGSEDGDLPMQLDLPSV
jgi:hypothetical protein